MKMFRTLFILLCLLPQLGWGADEDSELSLLRQKAAVQKDVKGYSAVCEYLSNIELHPDLLLLYADSIYQLAMQENKAAYFMECYRWRGEAYFIQGDFTNGAYWYRKTLALAERDKRLEDAVTCCANMGYYFNVAAQYDSARYYLKRGIDMTETVPSQSAQYRNMLTNYASSFLFEGKTDSALVYALRAEKRSLADKDTAMWIENLNQLGTIYRRKKSMDECVENFKKALSLCEAQGNFRTATYIYGNIATVYGEWKRPADAIPFSQKALEYALKYGTPQMIGIFYVNLGAIQISMPEKKREAIATLQKAIPVLESVNNKRRLCEAYNHLTNAYLYLEQADSAMYYLHKLEALSGELKTDVERYRYHQARAQLLQYREDYAGAVQSYRHLTDMLEAGYRDSKDYEHYLHLSECYHALHCDGLAYDNLYEAYAIRDSAFYHEYTEQLSDFSVKYQTQEKELEIARLRQSELEREELLLRNRVGWGGTGAALLIVILVFLYIRQRQKVKLARLAQSVGEKERQFLVLQKETEQRLTQKYIDGLESERERMATELHDDVCNSLLAFEMNFRSMTEEGCTPAMNEQLTQLSNTRERLRNMSHELMPPAFQYATIDEMLSDYLSHLALPKGLKLEYHATELIDWKRIPQNVGFEFYRIAQEAVANAVKYAEARHIRVELLWDKHILSLTVRDDGKGFDMSKKKKGIGLRTIVQRADAIGATVDCQTAPGAGVDLKVTVNVDYEYG
ncbi:MAG: tetratricopeptide repeat protein [Bacteroides sp.]|nr:tetratricopeptide repeat protein [Bacteroides sp.]